MSHLAKALSAWGDAAPDWVVELAKACDGTSQNQVARQVGYSAATISYVLKNTYTGDLEKVAQAVRANVMNGVHVCPQLGEIALADCLDWQRKAEAFAPTSSRRLVMYRACRACPHYAKGGESC